MQPTKLIYFVEHKRKANLQIIQGKVVLVFHPTKKFICGCNIIARDLVQDEKRAAVISSHRWNIEAERREGWSTGRYISSQMLIDEAVDDQTASDPEFLQHFQRLDGAVAPHAIIPDPHLQFCFQNVRVGFIIGDSMTPGERAPDQYYGRLVRVGSVHWRYARTGIVGHEIIGQFYLRHCDRGF